MTEGSCSRSLRLVHFKSSDDPLFNDARSIRVKVFVEEQNVDINNEIDDIDVVADHIVLYEQAKPVGTIRLYTYSDTVSKIGRVAVLMEARGKGYGNVLMSRAEDEAKKQGKSAIMLHAQEDKAGFYQKIGYEVTNETVFFEEGIPHVKMCKTLT